MAEKSNTTLGACTQGGPVTQAIRAVREADAPWFVPVRSGDEMVTGFHLGRRRDWDDTGRQELVWLNVLEEDGEFVLGIYRAGQRRPEHPDEWAISHRLAGIRSTPQEPIELRATVLH